MTELRDLLTADPAKDDLLILVDGRDRELGTATKATAHVDGLLHRAFSVVLTREGAAGTQILLARRAPQKYHSAGLWANSCCSHPRAGESTLPAAERRVQEELGCSVAGLHEIGAFAYRAEFANGLCEFEYDHVLVGYCVGELDPDPTEADATRWVGFDELATELAERPQRFAAWAFMVLSMTMDALSKR